MLDELQIEEYTVKRLMQGYLEKRVAELIEQDEEVRSAIEEIAKAAVRTQIEKAKKIAKELAKL
jgi:nitrogen regulatory protein PII